jgi:hypothetical protein
VTQPPFNPAGTPPASDPTPTEPVPPFTPPPSPSSGTPGDPSRPAYAFAPAAPEPAPAEAWLPPSAPAGAPVPAPGRPAAGTRVLNLVLGVAVLVAAVGIAFAIGRVTAPGTASEAAGAGNRQELGAGPGFDDGSRPSGNGNGNGTNPGSGSRPAPSPGVNGNDGAPGFDGNRVFPGRGIGRDGFGGLGLTGTVTGVTGDSMTIQLDSGLTVTLGLDESTTYHQQAPATSSDVTTGDRVQVQVSGGFRPGQATDGSIDLGTAGDITIVP